MSLRLEIEASLKAINNGWKGCREMPHKTTISVMKVMDELRGRWNIRYPIEIQ